MRNQTDFGSLGPKKLHLLKVTVSSEVENKGRHHASVVISSKSTFYTLNKASEVASVLRGFS